MFPISFLKIIFKKILFIYFQREGKGGREKHQCVVASHMAPTGDLGHNPGMCLESNQQPFGSQAFVQSTEPARANLVVILLWLWENVNTTFTYAANLDQNPNSF